jgi:hypothetical protein
MNESEVEGKGKGVSEQGVTNTAATLATATAADLWLKQRSYHCSVVQARSPPGV